MDASSGTVGRVQSELIYSSQGGTMDASSAAVGEGRKQDERFVSMGCGKRLLGPGREGRKRDERFVSRGRSGRLLGLGREGRKSFWMVYVALFTW